MAIEFDPSEEKKTLIAWAEKLLDLAVKSGVDGCEVNISSQVGLEVGSRLCKLETIETTLDRSMGVTVFRGNCRGTASCSDLSIESVKRCLRSAISISEHTNPDIAATLAPFDEIIHDPLDLDLYHDWADLSAESATKIAIGAEGAGQTDKNEFIINSEANVSSHKGVSVMATSEGLLVAQKTSMHGVSCSFLAENGNSREYGYSYTRGRNPNALRDFSEIGKEASVKALARLNPQKLPTGEIPVLFNPETASGLLAQFFSAISGGLLFRNASFLNNRLNSKVFPNWVTLTEQPHILSGIGSGAFDSDGLPTKSQAFVDKGILQKYVLSLYSANRLGLSSTHNGGGVRNVIFSGDKSQAELMKSIDTGFLVTDMMGQGANLVTGDYSRGASGFWFEKGEIKHPVHEVTVASNLADLFLSLADVGNDTDLRRNIASGSMAFPKMMVAGG